MNSDEKRGRPEKPHIAKHLLLAEPIVTAANEVREKGETFTALTEVALDRETKRRLKARKRRSQPPPEM